MKQIEKLGLSRIRKRGEGRNDGGESRWVCPFSLALKKISQQTFLAFEGRVCRVED
jgi:hypothetical protein